jgi:Ca2+-binding RTX toxin-like protein
LSFGEGGAAGKGRGSEDDGASEAKERTRGMRKTVLLLAAMGATLLVAGGAALAASINCPNASGGYCYGTSVGDGMYGTANVDRMYGQGGADLMYGYGRDDSMYGGNETGFGDALYGGTGDDTMRGEGGDDGLYGGNGDDTIGGGPGNDIVQGDSGNDTLNTGKGSDRVNAQDDQKDFITCIDGANDLVYYDRGLDVVQGCGRSGLIELPPPDGLFERKTKVLVSHKGGELCLPESAVKGHLKHGDEVLNPQGCSDPEEGRN